MNLNKAGTAQNTNLVIKYSHSIHHKLDVLDYFNLKYIHRKKKKENPIVGALI